MKTIGITTTVPTEVLLAAGYKVIDLNNIFISSDLYDEYIDFAEVDGFPKSSCAWIKGIYGACVMKEINEVIGVVEGDCSNTKALLDVLKSRGIKVKPFYYPQSHKLCDVATSLNNFMESFGVTLEQAEEVRRNLNEIRGYARVIDELTFIHCKATGMENHIYQVSLSDFEGSPELYADVLRDKITEIDRRLPRFDMIRLGFIGVPPMTCDIYDYVEGFNARFIYNEVQREFAFPRAYTARNIYEQYYEYTYPYDMFFRLKEIKRQTELRRLDGIIHYTQAFCHKAIEDIIVKKELNVPVLTIEGDKLNHLDSRTKLRIEAFIDMLSDLKEAKS